MTIISVETSQILLWYKPHQPKELEPIQTYDFRKYILSFFPLKVWRKFSFVVVGIFGFRLRCSSGVAYGRAMVELW